MSDLTTYKTSSSNPWNFQRVWTLHRRTGFAATWRELQRDLADGPDKSTQRILAGESRESGVPENFLDMRTVLGDAAVGSGRPERLIAWWVYQMYFSPDALCERLVLMWHNHFATSNAKVENLSFMREQNEVFRSNAKGKFKTLLEKTLKQPAMLKWLDGDENRNGKSNENLGRETLELFTLGIGNYIEKDVKESSRALTGWSVSNGRFRNRAEWHDSNEKTILGKTGKFSGDDLIEITAEHPATAKRLAWRICDSFLSKSLISEKVINQFAEVLTRNQLDIHASVGTLIRSKLFFCDENLQRRIVEPESFVVGAVRAVEQFSPPASTLVLADWIEQLGRKLFFPPNVGGWPGGRGWLNSRTTIARANFGSALAAGNLNRSDQSLDFTAYAEKYIESRDRAKVARFYCELLTGTQNDDQVKQVLDSSTSDGDLIAAIVASPAAQLC